MFCDLFLKGLWDSETAYMNRYFPQEGLLGNHTKEELVERAIHLDQNHGLIGRSHQGQFHPWWQWLVSFKNHYDDWWQAPNEGRVRDRC